MKHLTNTQKTSIREFREAGLGYKSIAEKLSLSRETVRSFCTRNGISTGSSGRSGVETEGKVASGSTEVKHGGTVFIISTSHSERATETLGQKLEKLILDAVAKQSRSFQYARG